MVPDGLLHQIPFEVLVLEPGSPQVPSRDRLEEGPVIRYAASATALSRLALSAGGREDAVLPDRCPTGTWSGGSEGRPHPRATARHGPGGRSHPGGLRGVGRQGRGFGPAGQQAGGKERVRAALPGARYIHLATHGLVDETHDGLFATLALTPPPRPQDATDDGQLQLYEIYGLWRCARSWRCCLPARAAWEVWSPERASSRCRGGSSPQERGGSWPASGRRKTTPLPRSSASSSARRDAEDQRHRPDFAAALAQAKRAVRARSAWGDPFFWGPFVLEVILQPSLGLVSTKVSISIRRGHDTLALPLEIDDVLLALLQVPHLDGPALEQEF